MFSNRIEAIVALIALAIWCCVDVWPRGSLNPGQPHTHRTDFTVYTQAGKAALAGDSPYSVSNARGWTYLYLPPFALIVSPLAYLPEGLQCTVWFWISVACLYNALREFSKLNGWAFPILSHQKTRRFAQWGGLVCVLGFSLPTLNCLQRGQVGILQLFLTLLGTRLILALPSRKYAFAGGTLLACAIILKLSPALPTLLLFLGLAYLKLASLASLLPASLPPKPSASPLAMLCGVAFGIIVGVWVLPASLLGWEQNQSYLTTWRKDVLSRTNELTTDPFAGDSHSVKNQSPMNAFWLLGNKILPSQPNLPNAPPIRPMDSPFGSSVLTAVRWSSLCTTAIALIAILWRGKERELLVAFALVNAATLFIVPIARGHYFMAMWPATVWIPRWLLHRSPQPTRLYQLYVHLLAIIPPSLLGLHYLFERQLASFGVLGIGAWLWVLLVTLTLVVSQIRFKDR